MIWKKRKKTDCKNPLDKYYLLSDKSKMIIDKVMDYYLSDESTADLIIADNKQNIVYMSENLAKLIEMPRFMFKFPIPAKYFVPKDYHYILKKSHKLIKKEKHVIINTYMKNFSGDYIKIKAECFRVDYLDITFVFVELIEEKESVMLI